MNRSKKCINDYHKWYTVNTKKVLIIIWKVLRQIAKSGQKNTDREPRFEVLFSPRSSRRGHPLAEAHLSLDSVLLSHAIGRIDAGMISWGSLLDLWQDITTFLGEVSYAMSWSCRKVYWNRRNYSTKTDDAEEKRRRMFANTNHSACE